MLEVEKALERFRLHVIKQSKANLTKLGKNDSKKLYNSIDIETKKMKNSLSIYINMSDYGQFVDQGVKGKDPSKVSPNAKIKGQQAPNSPFRFGSKKSGKKFSDFVNSILPWVKRKGLRFRNEKGKYVKGSSKAVAYVTAANIYNRGLKPSLFFTKPFEKAFANLPDELIETYGIDAERDLLNQIIKK